VLLGCVSSGGGHWGWGLGHGPGWLVKCPVRACLGYIRYCAWTTQGRSKMYSTYVVSQSIDHQFLQWRSIDYRTTLFKVCHVMEQLLHLLRDVVTFQSKMCVFDGRTVSNAPSFIVLSTLPYRTAPIYLLYTAISR
jgi:hypothetical protein